MGSPQAGSQPSWVLCWVAGDFHISFLHICPVSLKSPALCLADLMGMLEMEVQGPIIPEPLVPGPWL